MILNKIENGVSLPLQALLRSYFNRAFHDTKWFLRKLKVIKIIYLDLSNRYINKGFFWTTLRNSEV